MRPWLRYACLGNRLSWFLRLDVYQAFCPGPYLILRLPCSCSRTPLWRSPCHVERRLFGQLGWRATSQVLCMSHPLDVDLEPCSSAVGCSFLFGGVIGRPRCVARPKRRARCLRRLPAQGQGIQVCPCQRVAMRDVHLSFRFAMSSAASSMTARPWHAPSS